MRHNPAEYNIELSLFGTKFEFMGKEDVSAFLPACPYLPELLDGIAIGQDDGALDDVFKFADIAGETI